MSLEWKRTALKLGWRIADSIEATRMEGNQYVWLVVVIDEEELARLVLLQVNVV